MIAAFSVRLATADDAHAIATVRVTTWRAAYAGLIPEEMLDRLDIEREAAARRRRWDEMVARGVTDLVAVADDEVLGWACFGPREADDAPAPVVADPSAHRQLYAIYAMPHAWSQGVGHALLVEAERRMREDGIATADLWVLDGNERAARFYERHGWHEDGVTKTDAGLTPGHGLHERRRIRHLA